MAIHTLPNPTLSLAVSSSSLFYSLVFHFAFSITLTPVSVSTFSWNQLTPLRRAERYARNYPSICLHVLLCFCQPYTLNCYLNWEILFTYFCCFKSKNIGDLGCYHCSAHLKTQNLLVCGFTFIQTRKTQSDKEKAATLLFVAAAQLLLIVMCESLYSVNLITVPLTARCKKPCTRFSDCMGLKKGT